ncbi:MAG: hypothetical protein JSR65_13540 [Proteobacteria bacterium]|nr:hypothetical protein [Pseudomonadota bacterium]
MFARLLPLLKLLAALVLVLLVLDGLVFRSGLYAPWIEMNSTAGATVGDLQFIRKYTHPAAKNILVLGNSQIGEGFSAPTADQAVGASGLHFVNGAIAGTSPRVWNYLLREIDPASDRFAAIAMMVDYDPAHWTGLFADYSLDSSYAAPLLRLSDLFDYPATFLDRNERERARRTILLPLQAMRLDILDFIAHPLRRYREIVHSRPAWLEAAARYPGRDTALPDLPIDDTLDMPTDWGAQGKELQAKLEPYFHGLKISASKDTLAANIAYEHEWIGRIAARYRAKGIPVFVFSVPRGPWHGTLVAPAQPNAALLDLSRAGLIRILPGDAFVSFEKPGFFFDTLHMNHLGREAFSQRFAEIVAPLVP